MRETVACLLTISGGLLVACHSVAQIDPEEYAVYSTFITNEYLRQDTRPMFTLDGVEVRAFLFDRIEEVLIHPETAPTIAYYARGADPHRDLPATPDWRFANEAFNDYLAKSGRPYALSDKLAVPVRVSFVSESGPRRPH